MRSLPPSGTLRLPLLLGGAAIVLLGAGAVLLLRNRPAVSTNTAADSASGAAQPVDVPVRADADADGLTDAEEAALRTDVAKADTDGDGLTDREEAKVYTTDPAKADTDGDGHSDGEEVAGGFNPKGDGALLPTPEAIQSATPANTNAGS